jgi:HD-like signal output (HDOD) protein
LTVDFQSEIRRLVEQDRFSRVEAEKQITGADHAEVGGQLLQSWHLPEEIVEAVSNHHHPVVKPRPRLSVVTHLANCVAHLAGSAPGWDAYAVRVNEDVMKVLDIQPERIEIMVAEVRESFDKVDQFMSMS